MQNYESGHHLQLMILETVCTVSPLQRGFKLEKWKYMCIIQIPMSFGISLQMQGLFFSKLSFFSLVARVVFSWPFRSKQDLLHALTARESHWQACGWQLRLKLLSPSLLPNSHKCWASTTHRTRSERSEPPDEIGKNIGSVLQRERFTACPRPEKAAS